MHADQNATMTIADLQQAGVRGRILGAATQLVTGVQHDSRRVTEGDLFVAIPGHRADGLRFVDDALARGAVAVMAEREVETDLPQLVVEDARLGLALAAELVCGRPTAALRTVGITGTNGKTTTASLVKAALEPFEGPVAMIGTTGLAIGETMVESAHTTPEGDDISRFARRAIDSGSRHLVIEVSSHGLALRRVDAITFEVAAFTNLSRDHLDFHGSFEAYGEAKARLFTDLSPRHAVVHIDDPFGAELAKRCGAGLIRCSRRADSGAEIVATEAAMTREGISASVRTPAGTVEIRSPMLGEHNLENLLVALGCLYALGYDLDQAADVWRTTTGSPGRLERIEHPGDVAVLVDYAHTPDALARVLDTMRAVTPGRLLVVFGAGGDRDRGKRPQMGAVAGSADLAVITSDNPRTEDPEAILDQIVAGAEEAGLVPVDPGALRAATRGYVREADRRAAIALAIGSARPGDTVLIAGKGHETYQLIGTDRLDFDDRDEARRAIAERGGVS